MGVIRQRSSGPSSRRRLAATIVACLLAAAWLAGCVESDKGAGIWIVNDTDREVQIWYEVDGVETLQRSMAYRMAIAPTKTERFRLEFVDDSSTQCTDSPIRARAGEEVVAVIPPGVCADGKWLSLSEWAP